MVVKCHCASSRISTLTSLMPRSVILFVCLMIQAQCRAEDLLISFTDFLALANGHFDNFEKELREDVNQDKIELNIRPALAPGLQKDPVMYFEETINGKLYRMWIGMRNNKSNDHTLYLNYYNFTDPSQHKPGTFNIDLLANLTREDFHTHEGCEAAYKQVFPGTLLGDVIDCQDTFNGQYPSYVVLTTCWNLHFVPPIVANETTTILPYDLKRKGLRYPLIRAPEGYVSPCAHDDQKEVI